MVSVGARYWFLISIILLLSACGPSTDQRGEIIPPKSVYKLPQRPEIIVSYITQLLKDSDGAQLYYLRAKAYYQLRDYVHAAPDIQKALAKSPGDEDYLLLSAQVNNQLGRFSQALEESKSLEMAGFSSPALFLELSELYLASNAKRLAASYLQKAKLAGIPSTEKAYADYLGRMISGDSLQALLLITPKDLNHQMLSRTYFAYQLPKMSHLMYQKSILAELKKYPFDPYLLLNWGRFLVQLQQYDRAEKVFLNVLLKLPQNPVLILEVGEFYMRLGNYKQALSYLDQIPRQSGLYQDAMYNRALAYLNSGQKSRTIAILDSGQREFVSDQRFIQMRDRLLGKRLDSTASKVDSTLQKSD
jgi:predicted Zn-dependent protease